MEDPAKRTLYAHILVELMRQIHPGMRDNQDYYIELLVEKAIETEDADDRLAFVSYLYRLMRSFYNAWNRDNPEDVVLLEHLMELSDGKLATEIEYIRQNGPIEASPKDRNSNVDRSRGNTVTGYKAQTNFNNDRAKNTSNAGNTSSGTPRNHKSNKFSGRNNNNSNSNNNNRNRRK